MSDTELRDALYDADEWRPENVEKSRLEHFKGIRAVEMDEAGYDQQKVLGWIGRHGGRLHRVEAVTFPGFEGEDAEASQIPAVNGYLIPRSALDE